METLIATVIIAIVIVGLCVIGLAAGIILKKNGKFPEIHIGRNKEMAKRGIHCASSSDFIERRDYKAIDTSGYTGKASSEID